MVSEINKVQELNFELMKQATFNGFNGKKVVEDLIAHKELWEGVVMDREGYGKIDLIKLRDISDNYWNIDTVFILLKKENKAEVLKMAKKWGADEVDFITKEDAQSMMGYSSREDDKLLLRVWWD